MGRSLQVKLALQISRQPNCPLRCNARTVHREYGIPIRLIGERFRSPADGDVKNSVPFGTPPDFVHNRSLQFWRRPAWLGHLLLRVHKIGKEQNDLVGVKCDALHKSPSRFVQADAALGEKLKGVRRNFEPFLRAFEGGFYQLTID